LLHLYFKDSCIDFHIKGTISNFNSLYKSFEFHKSIKIQLGLLSLENIFAFILVVLTHILTGTQTFFIILFCKSKIYSSKFIPYNSGNHVTSQKASSIEKGSIDKVFFSK